MSIWRARSADDVDRTNTIGAFDLLAQRFISIFGQLAQRRIAGERQSQNRRGIGIEGIDGRLINVFGQARQHLVELVRALPAPPRRCPFPAQR